MKHAYKEVISNSEAQRFARNLCKKRAAIFPSLDEALAFVVKIRTVISDDAEFERVHREQCERLAWVRRRKEQVTTTPAPTVTEVEAAGASMRLPIVPRTLCRCILEQLIGGHAMDWIEHHFRETKGRKLKSGHKKTSRQAGSFVVDSDERPTLLRLSTGPRVQPPPPIRQPRFRTPTYFCVLQSGFCLQKLGE